MPRIALLIVCLAIAPSWTVLAAQDAPPTPVVTDVKALIEQLEAPKFNDRQAATQKLTDLGRTAIPELVEAAGGISREASSRSIDILKKFAQSKDDATHKAAREGLEKLAKSSQARVAAAATEALKPKLDPDAAQDPFAPPVIQLNGGQIQVQVQAIGGNVNRRVDVQNVNGVKTTTVEENNRKVKVVDDPQKGINLEVTEKIQGKEQTKKYEAKDADDLKKKHPDAHKIYEETIKNQNIQNIQIQFNGGVIPAIPGGPLQPGRAFPVPFQPAVPLNVPPKVRQSIAEQLERAGKELQEAQERVKKVAANSPQSDELAKAIQQLEGVRKQLEEAVEKLTQPKH